VKGIEKAKILYKELPIVTIVTLGEGVDVESSDTIQTNSSKIGMEIMRILKRKVINQ
jgi:hypothetical protein